MRSQRLNSAGIWRWLRSGGWTLMFVLGPSRQTRRLRVPRWAALAACAAWLALMVGAGVLGFITASESSPEWADAQGGTRMATAPRPRSRQ